MSEYSKFFMFQQYIFDENYIFTSGLRLNKIGRIFVSLEVKIYSEICLVVVLVFVDSKYSSY